MFYEIEASEWLNTDKPLTLEGLRGKIVVVTVFQMLCPGCVQTSLPQAAKLNAVFSRDNVVVIGMHSVFEHHEVMTPAALKVFASEYRLSFPIAIDKPQERSFMPTTMAKWALEGTPSLLVFDHEGSLVLRHFGHVEDLQMGVLLGQLLARKNAAVQEPATGPEGEGAAPVCRT